MKNPTKPICPKCKAEIDYLNSDQQVIEASILHANGFYTRDEKNDDSMFDPDYYCPQCGIKFCFDEEEAIKFLNPNPTK